MAREDGHTIWRSNSRIHNLDPEGTGRPDYDEWSDERLVDGYRRNSRLLREYGTDVGLIRALCGIEECLRVRGIDPYSIIDELDAEERSV